jgi:tetratricopeptide (TPR) repeat protein
VISRWIAGFVAALAGCASPPAQPPPLAPTVRFEALPLGIEWDEMPTSIDARRAEAGRRVAEGEKLIASGDMLSGVAHLRRAVDLHPGNAPMRIRLAAAFEQLGDPDAALRLLREGMRVHSKDAATLLAFARVVLHTALHRDAEDLDAAIAALRRLSEIAPASDEARRGQTLLPMLLRVRERSIRVSQRAGATTDPSGSLPVGDGATAPSRAIDAMTGAMPHPERPARPTSKMASPSLDPDDALIAGNALLERGLAKDAAAAYERALTARPGDAQARWLLGLAWHRAGERVKALDIWQPLLHQKGALRADQRALVESLQRIPSR